MPWKESTPMDQKLLFMADYIRGHTNLTVLCEQYGISRKTGYKWIKRYHQSGMEGLQEHSRRPHHCPNEISYTIRHAIVEIRQQGRLTPGPKKIRSLLAQRFPQESLPSKTSIYNILKRAGLVEPRRRRRKVAPSTSPFTPTQGPNEVWSTDFKGQFKLGSGPWCYPLTVMDHHSRFLLACRGMKGTTLKDTQRVFTHLFRTYGLPLRIRSDNGVPFASTATGGLSRLSIWWIKLGIVPERITPGKPQQNGRHERMHRTLKKATVQPPASSFKAQQQRFDTFRQEYNAQRPHEALNQTVPATHYQASTRPYPNTLPEIDYPGYFTRLKVRPSGIVYWNRGQVYISHLLNREYIGMEEVDEGVWDVYFGPVRIGGFNVKQVKGNRTPYWTLKV